MKGNRAAIRYAKSLIQLSKEKGQFEEVLADVKMLASLIEESRDLDLFLANPLVKMDKRSSILKSMFEGKLNSITYDFIQLVVTHKRESILKLILEQFIAQYNLMNKIAKVSVSTAVEMNDKLKEQLVDSIMKAYDFSAVQLEEKVDEALIGGLLMRIGDKQLDATIRRQLNDIEKELVHTK